MVDIDEVQASWGRCLLNGNLLDEFYERLFRADSRVREYFKDSDMERQKALLQRGIGLVVMYSKGKSIGESGMRRVALKHNKSKLDVKPGLYSVWKRTFIQLVSEHDPKFDSNTRRSWDAVLQKAIDLMVSLYESDARR